MNVAPTPDDAQAVRQLTLADEHLMICFCGVNVEQDAEARILQETVQKFVRIKMQMGSNHRIGLATARGSRLAVLQEFTRDVDAVVSAIPELLSSSDYDGVVDFNALLADAARHFGVHREMERQAVSSFRLVVVLRHVKQTPQLQANQGGVSLAFTEDPGYHLDVIYWHQDVALEAAQNLFDQLCAYDSANPFAKFYVLEVGGSVERLHQAFVLILSHPAHRLSQNVAEQLLGSCFSPSKGIDSVRQQD